jgi:DNA-binding transcriptional LysR family regulator
VAAALRHVDQAFEHREFDAKHSQRTFHIGTTDEVEMLVFPSLLRALQSAAPSITLSCKRLYAQREPPIEQLRVGNLDFAIGMFPLPHPEQSELSALPLYEGKFVCIARRRHPSIRKRVLTLREFLRLPHAVTYYPGEGPGLFDRILLESGHARRIGISVAHCISVPFIVASSDLIATIQEPLFLAFKHLLPLQRLPCPVRVPALPVSLTWHARNHADSASRWFRTFAAAVIQKTYPAHALITEMIAHQ